MPSEPRTLKSADFGAFEPDLKRAFKEAFHFAWNLSEESPEELERRRKFSKIITTARSVPDAEPTAGVALMRECYALHLKICTYLNPDDFLRDELAAISASISRTGKKIARLPIPAKKSSQRKSVSVLELRSAWTVLETQLRAVDEDYVAGSVPEELARLRDAAARVDAQVTTIRALLKDLSVGSENEVIAAEQATEVRAIAAAAAQISRELRAFGDKCVPPAGDSAEFRAYFERVEQSLPVQSSPEGNQGVLKHRTEVPWDALAIPRDLPERRGAVLETLCTWDPEFFPLLPGAVRRDHRAPATAGGRGRVNWVLNGIAAALVLLELVDVAPIDPKASGKDLFKSTIKRVERWIDTETTSGRFYVDATPEQETRARRRSGRSKPLQARFPIKPAP